MQADVYVGVNYVLAGVTLSAGLACFGIAKLNSRLREFGAMAALAAVMSVQLIAGAVVIAQPGPSATMAATFVRSLTSMSAAILAIHITGRLVPRLNTGRIVQVLLVIAAVRIALWWPTELIVRHPVGADGWPSFGPLGFTWLAFVVGLAGVGVRATFLIPGRGRGLMVLWLVAFVLLGALPGLVDDRLVFEELVTLNVLPGGLAILVLAAQAVRRGARNTDLLAHRQRVFARVGRAAMYESVDSLRLSTERALRTELGSDDLFLLLAQRSPGTQATADRPGSVTVLGRRQVVTLSGARPADTATGEFVESLLRIVVAAADRAAADAEFAHRAVHDELTGLPNLELLRGRLDDRLVAGTPTDVLFMLCRVGRMGRTVAAEGFDHGNALLVATADALLELRRPDTIVARMSTEHFGVLEYLPPDDPEGFLVRRLRAVRAAAEAAADGVVHVGAVVGRPGSTADSMLSEAATAVERSRAAGHTIVFDAALTAQLRTRVDLERALEHAVDRGEIEVRYQPVANPRTRAVIGCEALARWRRDGELTPPAIWIPLAERSGLIHDIGRRVLSIAAAEQPRLGVPVAVNVSPLELAEDHFVDDVLQAIGTCPPELVTLELTEGAVMADLHRSIAVLQELRACGLRVALDDFGSSYSSLGALADLPVDVLKLDRSFVDRLTSSGGLAIVQAIVTLAHSLGKPIVAEGVETEQQLDLLVGLGVDRVQGFLLGRPVSADRVASRRSRPVPHPAR